MADKSLRARLGRLFATNVVVRRIAKNRLKAVDTNRLQSTGNVALVFPRKPETPTVSEASKTDSQIVVNVVGDTRVARTLRLYLDGSSVATKTGTGAGGSDFTSGRVSNTNISTQHTFSSLSAGQSYAIKARYENAFDDGVRPKAKMRPETSRKSSGDLGAYTDFKVWTEGMFSIYTSSLGLQFTNMHQDLGKTAYNLEAKLQSPFTKKHVGTMPHRSVEINIGNSGSLDSTYDRPEAFRILVGEHPDETNQDGALGFVPPDYGVTINVPVTDPRYGRYPDIAKKRATYYREEKAKNVSFVLVSPSTVIALNDESATRLIIVDHSA